MNSERKPIALSPSILATELISLADRFPELEENQTEFLHLDVMDGNFVPQLSFGEKIAAEIRKRSSIPLDVHLMVEHPEREVPKYLEMQPAGITFHLEATDFAIRLSQEIRRAGIRTGIALNPSTPVHLLEPLLDHIDWILIMSVEPGFYGQAFIPSCLEKVRRARELIGGRDIYLSVDGGINSETIQPVYAAGADIVVAGSAVFRGDSISSNMSALRQAAIPRDSPEA